MHAEKGARRKRHSIRSPQPYCERTRLPVLSYFGFLDFFFLWTLASLKLDSAKPRNVAASVRLIDSVSSLSAATANVLANFLIRLRAFLLKRKVPPIIAIITPSVERQRGCSTLGQYPPSYGLQLTFRRPCLLRIRRTRAVLIPGRTTFLVKKCLYSQNEAGLILRI